MKSLRKELATILAEAKDIDRRRKLGEKVVGAEAREDTPEERLVALYANDPGLAHPDYDDFVEQGKGLNPHDEYSLLQIQLCRGREAVVAAQMKVERLKKNRGPFGGEAVEAAIRETEELLDKSLGPRVRAIEQKLVTFCDKLIAKAERGGK